MLKNTVGCVKQIQLPYVEVVYFSEERNEPRCSIKDGEMYDQLRDGQLRRNDSTPWSYLA
jgi:hypothetical protein